MPRRARITVVNAPHHIYQRTFNNRVVFYGDRDRKKYLELLAEQAARYRFDVLAFCLLKDAVHIIGIPRRKESLTKTIGRTNFSYTHYINARKGRQGRLWRNRFMSCALDDKYLKIAALYIESLPVREKLVRKAEKYPWSSALPHTTGMDDFDILALDIWPSAHLRRKWGQLLRQKPDNEAINRLKVFTQTGRPLGSAAFVDKLEKKFRCRLHPLPVGRPKSSDQ